jgi:hypothetical protein
MPFRIRPHRRFPLQWPVTYGAGPFEDQDTAWNLSCIGISHAFRGDALVDGDIAE